MAPARAIESVTRNASQLVFQGTSPPSRTNSAVYAADSISCAGAGGAHACAANEAKAKADADAAISAAARARDPNYGPLSQQAKSQAKPQPQRSRRSAKADGGDIEPVKDKEVSSTIG